VERILILWDGREVYLGAPVFTGRRPVYIFNDETSRGEFHVWGPELVAFLRREAVTDYLAGALPTHEEAERQRCAIARVFTIPAALTLQSFNP
jgi:hypothetical protein